MKTLSLLILVFSVMDTGIAKTDKTDPTKHFYIETRNTPEGEGAVDYEGDYTYVEPKVPASAKRRWRKFTQAASSSLPGGFKPRDCPLGWRNTTAKNKKYKKSKKYKYCKCVVLCTSEDYVCQAKCNAKYREEKGYGASGEEEEPEKHSKGSPPPGHWKAQDCEKSKWKNKPYCKCISKCIPEDEIRKCNSTSSVYARCPYICQSKCNLATFDDAPEYCPHYYPNEYKSEPYCKCVAKCKTGDEICQLQCHMECEGDGWRMDGWEGDCKSKEGKKHPYCKCASRCYGKDYKTWENWRGKENSLCYGDCSIATLDWQPKCGEIKSKIWKDWIEKKSKLYQKEV